ncbi:MAG TPA: ABC transporter permease, partial [Burkholderiales bacterium]|nr:ABC transporter permease [Burkholderiales bacterium]
MSAVAQPAYRVPVRHHPVLAFILRQPLGAAGLAIILVMIAAAIGANVIAPYDPLTVDYANLLAAPSGEHWLGTDSYGRDVLTRIIYGARTALAVGFLSSILGSTVGAMIGVAS